MDDADPARLVEEVVGVHPGEVEPLLGVLVEPDLAVPSSLDRTGERFPDRYAAVTAHGSTRVEPAAVGPTRVAVLLRRSETRALDRGDDSPTAREQRTIVRIRPGHALRAQVDRSVATIEADADRDVTWAVRRQPRRAGPTTRAALTGPHGHGTHVAGLTAGAPPAGMPSCLAAPPDRSARGGAAAQAGHRGAAGRHHVAPGSGRRPGPPADRTATTPRRPPVRWTAGARWATTARCPRRHRQAGCRNTIVPAERRGAGEGVGSAA